MTAVFDFAIPKGEPGIGGVYKGVVNATVAGTDPGVNKKVGDIWINNTAGTAGWADMGTQFDPLAVNDRLIWNGSQWDIIRSDKGQTDWSESNTSSLAFLTKLTQDVMGQNFGPTAADTNIEGDMDNVGNVAFSSEQTISTKGSGTNLKAISANAAGEVQVRSRSPWDAGKELQLRFD